ncbi:hypothetical protein T265_03186 [Opisthorchis viverrini]|uniref:Uncharacterized protein n=1 Tax=Opisthorchis viverrini TaxID=6198 RepID=A0A074ZT98_OPIVI|nr:hypothetical protein T265_03186 [Opisthorchis viverrini]KER30341.1 hypothetical protein T265_03186 [Opisthorchis viverrini]
MVSADRRNTPVDINMSQPRDRSWVGHLSVYATLSWAWKTALSSANDGSAYVTHVPTNAASGAGHILQWKYPLHNRKHAF